MPSGPSIVSDGSRFANTDSAVSSRGGSLYGAAGFFATFALAGFARFAVFRFAVFFERFVFALARFEAAARDFVLRFVVFFPRADFFARFDFFLAAMSASNHPIKEPSAVKWKLSRRFTASRTRQQVSRVNVPSRRSARASSMRRASHLVATSLARSGREP